jgi:hypothetical protein
METLLGKNDRKLFQKKRPKNAIIIVRKITTKSWAPHSKTWSLDPCP